MTEINNDSPLICHTAAGFLIDQNKIENSPQILLVLHKKLKIWLAPGGHVEPNELPHQTAQREFFEETGIRVIAEDIFFQFANQLNFDQEKSGVYFPTPICANLHWISKENYQKRLQSDDASKRYLGSKIWSKGCEQHFGMIYLVKPNSASMSKNGSLLASPNRTEVDDLAWFNEEQIASITTTEGIKKEIALAFKLFKNKKMLANI